MERRINFSKYYLPKDVEGFELFIGPAGEYYKIKTIFESDLNCTHYEWAKEYLIENNIKNESDNSDIFYLINYLGFIIYSHFNIDKKPLFETPNEDYYGVKINKKQQESVLRLLIYNKESISEKQKRIFDDVEEMHNGEPKRLILKGGNYYENK